MAIEWGRIAVVVRHSDLHITLVNNPKSISTIERAAEVVHDAVNRALKKGGGTAPAVDCASLLLGIRGTNPLIPAAWFWTATEPQFVEHLIYVDYEESPTEITYGKGKFGTSPYDWDRRSFHDVEEFAQIFTGGEPIPGEPDSEAMAKVKAKLGAVPKKKAAPAAATPPSPKMADAVKKLAAGKKGK